MKAKLHHASGALACERCEPKPGRRVCFLPVLLAVVFLVAGRGAHCAASNPVTHVSPVQSLPLGSYEALEQYGMEQVARVGISIHKWIPNPDAGYNGYMWARGEWWTQVSSTHGPYDEKDTPVLEFMNQKAQWFLDLKLDNLVRLAEQDSPDNPNRDRFLIDVGGIDFGWTFAYVVADHEFRVSTDGGTPVAHAATESLQLEVVRYGYGMYAKRWPIIVPRLVRAKLQVVENGTLQEFDSRDTVNPNDMYSFAVREGDVIVQGDPAVFVPLRYAMGQCPGTLTLYYDEDGFIGESFDLATGLKLVPSEPRLRLIGNAEGMTLIVEGAGPSAVAIEHAATPAQWEPFATIENYTGFAWISGVEPVGSHRFFRATGNP